MKRTSNAKPKTAHAPIWEAGDVLVCYGALCAEEIEADIAHLASDAVLTLSLHGTLRHSELGSPDGIAPKLGEQVDMHELRYAGYERQPLMRVGELRNWRGRRDVFFPKCLMKPLKGGDESKPYPWYAAIGCNGLIVHGLNVVGGRRGLQKGETPVVIFMRD